MSALLALLVPPEKTAEIRIHEHQANAIAPDIEVLEIATPEDEQMVADIREHLRGMLKELETTRTAITAPMNEAKRAVDKLFKPTKDRLESMIETCDDRLKKFRMELRAKELASEAIARAAAKQGQVVEIQRAASKPQGVSFSWKWTYFIVDAQEVEEEFRGIAPSKIQAFCDEWEKSETIPPKRGIRFDRVPSVRGVAK